MIKRITVYFILLIANISICNGQQLDSLKKDLINAEGHQRIEILHQLILSVWLNYPDQGLLYGKESLELSKSLNDSINISKSLRLLGGVKYYQGDYDASLDLNVQALDIAELIQDSLLITRGFNNIGLLYYDLGSYQTALEFLLRAKNIKERNPKAYRLSTTLNNIGLVHVRILNFDIARKYFFEALTAAQSRNNDNQIVYSQNNIGITYLREKNYVLAKHYFEKSLKLANEIGNINWGAVSLRGIGEVLEHQEQYDSAIYYYQKSLDASKSIDDKKGMAEVYYLFSKVENLKGNNQKAIGYLEKGQAIAKLIEQRQQLLDNLQLYIKIYRRVNNKDKTIEYQKAYIRLQDSLFQDVVGRNLNLVPVKIEDEKERLKIPLQQAEIRRKDFTNTVLFMILLFATPLIMVLIIFIQKNVSKNKKLIGYNLEILSQKGKIETQKEVLEDSNLELEKAKHLISEQKNELEILNVGLSQTVDIRTSELKDVNEELRVTNLELDNLIYKSSHDIRGPLLRLIGVCNIALMEIDDKKAIEYFKMIDKASKRLNNTIDKLKIITELNVKEIVSEPIDLLSIIDYNLEKNKYIEGLENVIIVNKIEDDLNFYSDPSVVDIIIFNMIQNAVQLVKGLKIDSIKLLVSIKKENNFLVMTFEIENIDLEINQNDVFYKNIFNDSDENQMLSIGLYTVKECVQRLGGEFLLLGDIIQATRFIINLPLHIK